MAEPNLLEIVKQGEPKAIEALLKQAMSSTGITARASLGKSSLHILLETNEGVDRQKSVAFVHKKLIEWQVTCTQPVKVHERTIGRQVTDWTEELDLRTPANNATSSDANSSSNSRSSPLLSSNSQESLEQLEALTGCDEQLQFAATVIDSFDVSEAVRVELLQQLNRLQSRRSNPNLYLAVVGEFSSGKSTFINALLRDELLKTSALVATAAATKLRFGDDLKVEVRFKGPRSGVLTTRNEAQFTVPWLPGVNGVDTRQFIHIVTSSDEVAREVVLKHS